MSLAVKVCTALSVFLFVCLYANNFHWLWNKWMINPDYSHGPLIPLLSLYILYTKRDRIRPILKKGSNAGIFLIAPALLLELFAIRSQVNFLSSYSMIVLLLGIVLYLWGTKTLSEVLFPILFLVFMVPFWGVAIQGVSTILKQFASILSVGILRLVHVPVFRDGVMLYFANGTLEVANPCSGIRSLMSILALGVVIAYFSYGSYLKKTFFVLLGIPLAFLANTLRIVVFGILLAKKGIHVPEGTLHDMTGFVVFFFALAGLIACAKLLGMFRRQP